MRTPIARGACELPINKIIIKTIIMKKIPIRIRESTVLPFIKIKDSSIKPPSKNYQTHSFFLTKRWKAKKKNRTKRN